MDLNPNTLVSVTLALQFAAFGWRINREIPVGDAGRRTWFPISDIINVLSMLSVVLFCVVLPLANRQFDRASAVVLSVAGVLLAFHPICMIGHYKLFSREGRWVYLKDNKDGDFPYCTGLELGFIILGILLASAAGWFVWQAR